MKRYLIFKRVHIFILLFLFISIAVGFLCEKPVYANTGELQYRYYNSTSWTSQSNQSLVPLPSGFLPLGYQSNRIYIISTTTGEVQQRLYNDTFWTSLGGQSLVPLPSSFLPLGYQSNRIYIISTTTGEVQQRLYNDTIWTSLSGQSLVALPSDFSPLTYDNLIIYIINPSTGEIQYRTYNNTSWTFLNGQSLTPIPGAFLPLDYVSNYVYILEATLSPTVSTQTATSVTGTTATANGTISSLGLPAATQYGFQWGPSSNPYLNQTSCGIPAGTGAYTLNLTGLTEGTLYYFRAYATSALGTTYGNQMTFTTRGAPQISINTDSQYLTELTGSNNLVISGSVTDPNVGDTVTIKYTIEGLSNHTDISLSPTLTATGSSQTIDYQVLINNTIPEGAYVLDVWAADSYGQSPVTTLNFNVDKSAIGANGVPALRVVTAEGEAFNVDINTGSFTNVTSAFLANNTGSGKPFYTRQSQITLFGTPQNFYSQSSAMAYIGNDTFRVVTAEGKAFDVNKTTGAYTDAPSTFLINMGADKPVFNRAEDHYFDGWGPFPFNDFGSTMAYIGNNTIRVVTSEQKAYDVNTLTGNFTDITSSFLNSNNFGNSKPFFLKEYTYTIGGTSNTFYDWGSSMAYIGNNTLRVVTSEGKAFDVSVTDGTWSEVTSTFLVNNFGPGKPFYLQTNSVIISGTNYSFYDWGSTMGYTLLFDPDLAITSPSNQTALDQIILTGTVYDSTNHDVTVGATIAGVSKSVTISNTATPKTWTLIWTISTDNIPSGTYSNIVIQAVGGPGETTSTTYTGTINVFGTGSGVSQKAVTYEYDNNGKLLHRSITTNP